MAFFILAVIGDVDFWAKDANERTNNNEKSGRALLMVRITFDVIVSVGILICFRSEN
jgi:hypothetical protein